MEVLLNFAIFIISFAFVWIGSGLIIKSVDKISRKLKVSSFAFSFLLLGILTSIPEISVAFAAMSEGTPEIFIGNLIGGIIVLFFLVIPIFAVLGNGIKITTKINPTQLLYAFVILTSPLVAVLDKKISITEALFMIILALVFVFSVQTNKGVLDNNSNILHLKRYSINDLFKVLLGIGIVFAASSLIVEKTVYFGELLNVSTFFISIIVLSIGTNIPEFSLVFRAIAEKKKDVAFGNYLGSATMNVIILAIMILLNGGEVLTVNSFWKTLVITVIGFAAFYHFTRSKNDLSRQEGVILLFVYVIFLILESVILF